MYLGHSLKAASVGVLLSKPLIQNLTKQEWILDIISYGFIRAGSFDSFYNGARGLPINKLGTTSLWDKAWKSVEGPESWMYIPKGICLTVGFQIPIKYF